MSIHIDPKFGHVCVTDEADELIADAIDYGTTCSVVAYRDLTPAEAIDVGRALIKWAGNVRKRRRETT